MNRYPMRKDDAEPSTAVQFDQEKPCDTCGRFGAFEFDGKLLCGDCYESHGSCCPEFGADKRAAEPGSGGTPLRCNPPAAK